MTAETASVKLTKAQRIEAAELLEAMACIYPGDPTGEMMREACELRGIPYEPPEVIITFESAGRQALEPIPHD